MGIRQKLFLRLPLLLSFLLGGIAGGMAVWLLIGNGLIAPESDEAVGVEFRSGGYRFINPLLECEIASDEEMRRELRPFKHKVAEMIEEKIDSKMATHISVYFRDLNNGPWFGINEREEFSPASLLKVPIMMAYFKLAESDPRLFAKKIKFESSYDANISENIKASKGIEKGKTYTVEELIFMMIAYSDNNAKELLLKDMGDMDFNKPFIDLGLEIPGVRKLEDFMPVKAYASFFRVLFNASYLSKEMSEKAMEFLSKVEFNGGLPAGVPMNITVARKFGERRLLGEGYDMKQLHDCGVIYYPKRPYLLCVMTRGYNFEALVSNVRDISFLVYEEIDHQQRNR